MSHKSSLGLGCCTAPTGTIYSITDPRFDTNWKQLLLNECKTFYFAILFFCPLGLWILWIQFESTSHVCWQCRIYRMYIVYLIFFSIANILELSGENYSKYLKWNIGNAGEKYSKYLMRNIGNIGERYSKCMIGNIGNAGVEYKRNHHRYWQKYSKHLMRNIGNTWEQLKSLTGDKWQFPCHAVLPHRPSLPCTVIAISCAMLSYLITS